MTKEAKVFNAEKDSHFNNWFGENRTATSERMNLDQHMKPCIKIKSKWVKDLSISSETTKLLEESKGHQLFSISLREIVLDLSPQARASKAKINKWDYMKLNAFFTVKKTSSKVKRQSASWEKMFANHILSKGLISGIHIKNSWNFI